MAPAWGVIGDALSTAAGSYLDTLVKLPDERLARRKSELDVETAEEKLASERREAAAGGKPISTQWGLYTIDPVTQRYKLELPRPEQQRKPFAKEAELELMRAWADSEDPYQRDIAKSYLEKQQAPARQVDLRSRQVDAQVQHLQKQEGYWQQRADEAKRHNSAMEKVYRDRAKQVSGALGSLLQAQEWEKSGTPEQQEAARRYLEGKDARGEKAAGRGTPPVDEAVTRLEALQQRSTGLGAALEGESQRLLALAQQLKAQGKPVAGYLLAEINKLDTQVRAAEVRAGRPPKSGGGNPSQVSVQSDPRGPTITFRGPDVERYYDAYREGMELLTGMSEKDSVAAVSLQAPGPRREGYLQAWRARYPGKVFRPSPDVVPAPAPRPPTSGRRGERDREGAITQPDTVLDQLAKERYGKKYVELEEAQKVDLEEEAKLITAPTDPAQVAPAPKAPAPKAPTKEPPALGPAPKPGTPEHRAYQTYRTEMATVPKDLALEAWEAVKTSGTAAEKQAFRRAYQEHFREELR